MTIDGQLRFVAPEGAYAGLPAWVTASVWLDAVKRHPRLTAACRGPRVAVPTFLRVLTVMSEYADVATGRGICVSHVTVAWKLGIDPKTVQRACRIAEDLHVLARVLDGADMSIAQRDRVIRHFTRGTVGYKWRSLPSFYAAVLPAELVHRRRPQPKAVRGQLYASTVDNAVPGWGSAQSFIGDNVHLPVRSTGAPQPSVRSLLTKQPTTSDLTCGETSRDNQTQDTATMTGAQRPTAKHHLKSGSSSGSSDLASLRRYAKDLTRPLLGFRKVSLPRICNALRLYRDVGLSPADLDRGLTAYLALEGISWRSQWGEHDQEHQAKYLIAMLTRARRAGCIKLPDAHWDSPDS